MDKMGYESGYMTSADSIATEASSAAESGSDETTGFSRRDFVKGAACAAVGAGIASLAGRTPMAQAESATSGSSQSASSAATSAATSAAASTASSGSSDETLLPPDDPASTYNPDNALALYANPLVTTQEERVADSKRILVVIDYQHDFIDGVFGPVQPAMNIEDALYDSIKDYQDKGDIVIYTMDTHPADLYDYTREGTFNPPHCIPGTEGWEIYGKVKDLLTPETAILVKKGTYGSKDLPGVVQNIIDQGTAIRSIEVAGISTTCRVLHNAIILYNFFPEVEMILDSKTTAGYSDDATTEMLKRLEGWGFVIKW